MNATSRTAVKQILIAVIALATTLSVSTNTAWSQLRSKKPDRGVYQPPTITPAQSNQDLELVDVDVTAAIPAPLAAPIRDPQAVSEDHHLRPVAHQEVQLSQLHADDSEPTHQSGEERDSADPGPGRANEESITIDELGPWPSQLDVMHDSSCDGCPDCGLFGGGSMGCDAMCCDADGCDSMGCSQRSWWRRSWWPGQCDASIGFAGDRWFGGIDLLMMWRSRSAMPPLVTTGTNADPDLAGQLNVGDTQILVGGGSLLDELTAGGRLTLGTWLDSRQCRSLVFRGWFAGEEKYGFNANQNTIPTIARPFLNVTDNQPAEQDTQLVAFPNRVDGSIAVNASNDVFGGDLQVRQFWYCNYGASVDFFYGYQYMRMNDDLSIYNRSTSLDDDFAPLGAIIAVSDSFRAENEFHGAQIGISSMYREGCWSFSSLWKTGFGNLRRRAILNGSTFTSIDGANATDPNGLLVRSTNRGTTTDDTFAWVPELDLTLGWHRYPRFDVTFGYHIIAMTEALQTGRMIDPNLAVNLATPPTGSQNPARQFSYQTFYVQGIHFGLRYVY